MDSGVFKKGGLKKVLNRNTGVESPFPPGKKFSFALSMENPKLLDFLKMMDGRRLGFFCFGLFRTLSPFFYLGARGLWG